MIGEAAATAGSANIAATLAAAARDRPGATAVMAPSGRDRGGRTTYDRLTFAELDTLCDELEAGLAAVGVEPGARTVLMVKPGLAFFALTFALFKRGAVPVLVDPGLGIKDLGRCLAESAPEAFIGIPKAQLARKLFGWGRKTIRQVVTVTRDGYRSKSGDLRALGRFELSKLVSPPAPFEPTDPGATAAILFTSGSTGPPKGVVYTHAMFRAQVDLLRSTYGIEPGEVDLCTFPLFALFAPALGLTSIVPEMDATRPGRVDPEAILGPIREFGVTNLFGSPALIRRVGDYAADRGIKLPTLRRVISAGAPVPSRVLATFANALNPGVQIFTPYGATESLPVCSIGSDEILGETRFRTDQGGGVCVGRPVEGMRVAILPIQDEPIPGWSDDLILPDGTIGEIAVSGPVVSRSYFRRNEANALAKMVDPASGTTWHRMGDVGARDEQGRIWFHGRKSHRVRTPSGTLFTIPCEAIFNTHPAVARTALVGVGAPNEAKPVLCVELKERLNRSAWERLRRELLALGQTNPITAPIITFLRHPAFPVDIRHNAKIFREKLAVWAARKLR